MIPETVDRVVDALSLRPRTVTVVGVERVFLPTAARAADGSIAWTLAKLDEVPQLLPLPEALGLHTLTGLVDYLAQNRDRLDHGLVSVHVVGPTEARVVDALLGSQRTVYTRATFTREGFAFGQFIPVEALIIELQAKFAAAGDRERVLEYISRVDDGAVRTSEDDSVRQEVTIRKGITMRGAQAVPNPVTLAPFRTFPEVEQPPSIFILRARGGETQPNFALFEADGGAWRLAAIAGIASWLRERLPEGVAVLA